MISRIAVSLLASWCLLISAAASSEPVDVVMVVWRGCEDACRGFQDYFRERGIDASFVILDAEQEASRLPGFAAESRRLKPDLVVTWGTSVTPGIVGRIGKVDRRRHVTGIPVVFMIVADPVGAGIVRGVEGSGRSNVTGTRNRVPERVQTKAIAAYRPLGRLGLIYNTDEVNAVLKVAELREVASEQGFELIELPLNATGSKPRVADIRAKVLEAARAKVDFLYVASSSFLMSHRDELTAAAVDAAVPLASAYEAMAIDSQALLAVAARYYNVGRLAGYQAEQILVHKADPATMPIRNLNRFSYIVNMRTARQLGLYPPLEVLRYAEIVHPEPDTAPADGAAAGLAR